MRDNAKIKQTLSHENSAKKKRTVHGRTNPPRSASMRYGGTSLSQSKFYSILLKGFTYSILLITKEFRFG